MKNIVLIMLFLITSLFNVSNSLANNITSMNGMKNVQETIQMAEPCHFEEMAEMAEMSHDSATPMDCEDCENCQMHCHNLSNNMIFAETKITSLEDTINVFNSKIQNFLKASYPNNLFRPPIV